MVGTTKSERDVDETDNKRGFLKEIVFVNFGKPDILRL